MNGSGSPAVVAGAIVGAIVEAIVEAVVEAVSAGQMRLQHLQKTVDEADEGAIDLPDYATAVADAVFVEEVAGVVAEVTEVDDDCPLMRVRCYSKPGN